MRASTVVAKDMPGLCASFPHFPTLESVERGVAMSKEIYPSSYECDCGHQSHFSENTVREAKAISHRKKVYLGDSEPDEHTIVFYKGEMVEILCPNVKPKKPSARKGAMRKRRSPSKADASRANSRVLSREQISITRETDYIIRRAEAHDARIVTLGALILFSTQTGDAWILDTEDSLALCLARAGERQSFHVIETPGEFGVEWEANYRIDGPSFVIIEPEGRVRTISGYPTRAILQAMSRIG